jgi:MFS family permease
MQTAMKLLNNLAVASLVAATAYFVPVVIVLAFHLSLTPHGEEILGMIMAFLPSGLAAYLLFRTLRERYGSRPALWTSIVFMIFAPASLLVAIVLAPFPGGYAELLLGGPFALIGAFVGIIVVITILTFGPSLLTLWLSRRGGRARQLQ